MLTATLNPDLSYATGGNPRREQMILPLALAIVEAAAIKVLGALLIAAMLIIPATAAHTFAPTPAMMAVWAAVIGAVAALGGLKMSFS